MSRNWIPDNDIVIVLALGIHRPVSFDEQRQVVDMEVAQRIHMENHDAKNHNHLVFSGKTTKKLR